MPTTIKVNQPKLEIPDGAMYVPGDPRAYTTDVYAVFEGLIIPSCYATAFGGPDDQGDDGSTASGVRTDGAGGIVGCSLPMPRSHACRGTPIPDLPWDTLVTVQLDGRCVSIPLIDVGPERALESGAFIDLTMPAWRLLLGEDLPEDRVNDLARWVSVSIPGVVHLLVGYTPHGVCGRVQG